MGYTLFNDLLTEPNSLWILSIFIKSITFYYNNLFNHVYIHIEKAIKILYLDKRALIETGNHAIIKIQNKIVMVNISVVFEHNKATTNL